MAFERTLLAVKSYNSSPRSAVTLLSATYTCTQKSESGRRGGGGGRSREEGREECEGMDEREGKGEGSGGGEGSGERRGVQEGWQISWSA